MTDQPPQPSPVGYAPTIANVAIVGAGSMGSRIAHRVASAGKSVILIDTAPDALDRAKTLHAVLSGPAELPRISYRPDLEAAADADLVIEAIREDPETKNRLFAALEAIVSPQAILASNSSSIPVSHMERGLASSERLLNMHFYITIGRDPTMAELMAGTCTAPAVINAADAFLRTIGVIPLLVQKESIGFIFNRIWRAIKKEALQVASDGIASIEDIDRAWMIMQGHSTGPFARMDRVGLDVTLDIERTYHAASGRPEDAPSPLLIDLVERGHLGVKSGRGFYTYPAPAYERSDFLHGALPSDTMDR